MHTSFSPATLQLFIRGHVNSLRWHQQLLRISFSKIRVAKLIACFLQLLVSLAEQSCTSMYMRVVR